MSREEQERMRQAFSLAALEAADAVRRDVRMPSWGILIGFLSFLVFNIIYVSRDLAEEKRIRERHQQLITASLAQAEENGRRGQESVRRTDAAMRELRSRFDRVEARQAEILRRIGR